MRQEDGLLTFLDIEAYIVEKHSSISIDSFEVLHFKYLVAWLTIHSEDDSRILTCGRCNLFDIKFLKHLLS